jgi:hypothetical protein
MCLIRTSSSHELLGKDARLVLDGAIRLAGAVATVDQEIRALHPLASNIVLSIERNLPCSTRTRPRQSRHMRP